MALEDLKKRLSRKDEDFSSRTAREPLPRHDGRAPLEWTPKVAAPPYKNTLQKILFWFVVGSAVAVAVAAAYFFMFSGSVGIGSNTQKLIGLSVGGGEEVVAGERAVWKVRYENKNQIPLESAVIVFEYPPGTQALSGELSKTGIQRDREEIGTIPPGTVGEETFSAVVFGALDEALEGKVSFEYRPQGSSVRLTKEIAYESRVKSSRIGIDIDMPSELRPDQELQAKLAVSSTAETPYKNLALRVESTDGFSFASAEPRPLRGNTIWSVGDLSSGDTFHLAISGKARDSVSAQTLKVAVGLFDRTDNKFTVLTSKEHKFKIEPALLEVSFVADGAQITAANSVISGRVRWQNNLPVAVSNAFVEVYFDPSTVDIKSVASERGEFDGSKNALRWVAGRIPELLTVDPGEWGEFSFDVRVRKDITVANNIVRLRAVFNTNEVPPDYAGVDIVGRRETEYRVATRLTFSQKGYYYDSRIVNAGPFPPKVGTETTFLIVWSVVNSTNDVDGVEVAATVPSYVRWTGVVIPSDGTLHFDEKTRKLVWSPGKIPAGAGFAGRAREVAFQVGLTPSLPQVGKGPELVSEASFSARDVLTSERITRTAREVTTRLPDDPRASRMSGVVIE
ncbi:MAG: hypothetical protein HY470_01170 [Candidatus Ryanbacteria bacterium]|nr:hypothetical protein [Candidatus Ryanbacteria bacterium]